MSAISRKERVEKTWAAVRDGDFDAVDLLYHPDYRRRVGPDDEGQSLAEFKASIRPVWQAFPDLSMVIDQILEEGDWVAIRWHGSGRHEGALLGVPATQRTVAVSGATFSRFEGDHIVEEFVTWDPRGWLTALRIIQVGADA